MPNRKDRFKPRAEASLLSRLIQEAWGEYQDSIASKADQDRIGEILAAQFEAAISPSDLEVLTRWKCVSYPDRCNVRVYNADAEHGKYAEAFGLDLPRKIPVIGNGGYGYPSLAACEPFETPKDGRVPADLDPYFAGLLAARKAYIAEYKASRTFPSDHKEATGQYPTWGEIEDRFLVLGKYLERHRSALASPSL